MKYIVLVGRIFYSALFIAGSLGHFKRETIDFAALQGVPWAAILVPLSGLIGFLGGLSILIGFKARGGAWLIVVFLVPVTLMMHAFWKIDDGGESSLQKIMFMKNLALLGAALLMTHFGSGPMSVDRR
ncbi:MAG TPA: DoxX family protein [Rhabdochlamydiaceae bacterium]|jgi:putative oxidoreductase